MSALSPASCLSLLPIFLQLPDISVLCLDLLLSSFTLLSLQPHCFVLFSLSDQIIISSEAGQNVTLPCRAPNNSILVVEWNRADLDEYVLLYRDSHLYPDNQHASFKNRVELQDIELKDGNVSLILNNVTITDSGTYKCFVVMEIGDNNKSPIITVNLNITDPPGESEFRESFLTEQVLVIVSKICDSVLLLVHVSLKLPLRKLSVLDQGCRPLRTGVPPPWFTWTCMYDIVSVNL
uniref:Ig-like domain-containing protein n=1 Tax=Neolamprologus brichardi TaxID=32507 RepID=A0A3Q4GE79_NEOBR